MRTCALFIDGATLQRSRRQHTELPFHADHPIISTQGNHDCRNSFKWFLQILDIEILDNVCVCVRVQGLCSLIPCSGCVGGYDAPLHRQREKIFVPVVKVVHVGRTNSTAANTREPGPDVFSVVAIASYRVNHWFYYAVTTFYVYIKH